MTPRQRILAAHHDRPDLDAEGLADYTGCTEQQVRTVIAAADRNGWAICPACAHERRLRHGILADHRAWDYEQRAMTRCPGSGRPPGDGTAAEPEAPTPADWPPLVAR